MTLNIPLNELGETWVTFSGAGGVGVGGGWMIKSSIYVQFFYVQTFSLFAHLCE